MSLLNDYSLEKNISKAREIFDFFLEFPKYHLEGIDWDWRKKRPLRTKYIFSLMSLAINDFFNEYTFYNPKYLPDILQNWENWLDNNESSQKMLTKIQFYKKMIEDGLTQELGEILVDLSSSPMYPPTFLSFAMEYENVPKWQRIIYDFRKLLYVSARIKIGIFHLPVRGNTKRSYFFDDEGNMKEEQLFLKWRELLGQLLTDFKMEINNNVLESKSTVYLIIFIRKSSEKDTPDIYGYLFNRKKLDEVNLTIWNSPEKQ